MAVQTCIECKAEKTVENKDGWLYISVAMCDDCLAAEEDGRLVNPEFDRLLKLEDECRVRQVQAVMGLRSWDRETGRKYLAINRVRLMAAVDRLSLDEMRAYGEYRKLVLDERARAV